MGDDPDTTTAGTISVPAAPVPDSETVPQTRYQPGACTVYRVGDAADQPEYESSSTVSHGTFVWAFFVAVPVAARRARKDGPPSRNANACAIVLS
ncbi:hypothetical protein EBO15_01545 [Actinomadura harenae]|uniref:Uncharacterized protein n=1 Tax=Actinomadura harenae TaxID=2483351 RepID=A0A3M2MFG3_9ACTN|nr:hypothetical protein EBO15_01545 [Actinomadura harenae]